MAGRAGCTFRQRAIPGPKGADDHVLHRVGNLTYFKDCSFKGSPGTRYVQVAVEYRPIQFGVAFDNCSFQLEGLQDGLLPVAIFNSKNVDDGPTTETADGLDDLVFCDPPLEVGVEDLTQGDEDTYYDLDSVVPDSLRVTVGPNLDKAPALFGVLGTDEDPVLQRFKSLLVRPRCCVASHLSRLIPRFTSS